MEENLISKKDLLSLTGISYGQLYRWKRKSLIPEEWFIKKASFTGQETFFPEDKILERIDKIKNMKDDLSLDEIADMFTPNLTGIFLSKEEIKKREIVNEIIFNMFSELYGDEKVFSFEKILYMYILQIFIESGEVSIEEGKNILKTIRENYKKIKDKSYDIILFRKFGAAICILVPSEGEIYVEDSAKLVFKVSTLECLEKLKTKIMIGENKI